MSTPIGSRTLGRPLGPWAQDAACLGDGALFFAARHEEREQAKAICQGCPVRVDCLTHAIDNDERFGIWGGKDERQRRAIANASRGLRGRR